MKIVDPSSIKVSRACVFPGSLRSSVTCNRQSSRRIAMRVAFQEQPRLDCPPVDAVPLNLHCRDEIIPILRALQHVYGQAPLRREILELVGNDANAGSSADHGREGLSYWTIMVVAGWPQVQHLLKKVRGIVRHRGRGGRAKGKGPDRLKPGYQRLLALAEDLLQRARLLLVTLNFRAMDPGIDWLGAGFEGPREELWHYLLLTEKG